jgi:hypothetical protein
MEAYCFVHLALRKDCGLQPRYRERSRYSENMEKGARARGERAKADALYSLRR